MSGAVRFAAEFIAAPDLDAASATATAKLSKAGLWSMLKRGMRRGAG